MDFSKTCLDFNKDVLRSCEGLVLVLLRQPNQGLVISFCSLSGLSLPGRSHPFMGPIPKILLLCQVPATWFCSPPTRPLSLTRTSGGRRRLVEPSRQGHRERPMMRALTGQIIPWGEDISTVESGERGRVLEESRAVWSYGAPPSIVVCKWRGAPLVRGAVSRGRWGGHNVT